MALPYSQRFCRIKREQRDKTLDNQRAVLKKHPSELLADSSVEPPERIQFDRMKRTDRDHGLQSVIPLPMKRSLRRTTSRTFSSVADDSRPNPYALDLRRGPYLGATSSKENHSFLARKLLYDVKKPVIDTKKVMMTLFDGQGWGTDGASSWWGRDDITWSSDTNKMEGIRVEHKEKSWSEDLLYQDNKYGWFVVRRPSRLRWSWTVESEQQDNHESRLDLKRENNVENPLKTERQSQEQNRNEIGESFPDACNSPCL
jgi:hypothetical protein